MTQSITTEHNPFVLFIDPAADIAAVERSERLGLLSRHLCRPLDRPTPSSVRSADDADVGEETQEPDAAVDVADAPLTRS